MIDSVNKTCKVVVAGHCCLDITPVFPQNNSSKVPGEIMSPGTLVEMNGVEISPGGAVSNTGIAMKLLGADVTLLTKTGNDEFGGIIKNIYGRYGVAEGVMAREGERTSYSTVIAIPGVDRIFLHDPGCNHTFSSDDIKTANLDDVKLFHFGYPPLMIRLYSNDGEELLEIMKYVKSKNIITSLDMAAVDPTSEAGRIDWDIILKRVLPYVDVFVPSVEELCFMLDKERFNDWNDRACGKELVSILTLKDIIQLADKCMEYGVKVLLLKCGAPGLYYKTSGIDDIQKIASVIPINADAWADRSGFENSYKPEKVLSGTGAGDTTIAAFLTSMIMGYDHELCVSLAAAEGASCVEDYSALGGIKSLDELKNKINNGWEKGDGLC